MEADVKYITDENGERTAAIIPIDKWNLLKLDVEKSKELIKLKESLEKGFDEAKKMISGELPKINFDQLIEEL